MSVFSRMLIVLAALLVPLAAPAVAAPDGAFGKTLGGTEKPAPEPAETTASGLPLYAFEPVHPYVGLQNYYVLVTPMTNRIYEIWGTGAYSSMASCERELDTVHRILLLRHAHNRDVRPLEEGGIRMLIMPRMNILAFCDSHRDGTPTLFLQYRDDFLGEEAIREEAELRATGVDIEGM